MLIHNEYHDLKLVKPVVTIGIFDGVHMGHKALLERLVSIAKANGGESVVITFDPHPRLVLDKNKAGLSFLTTMDEKNEILEKTGVDHLIMIRFTKKFSRMGACDFVDRVLVRGIKTSYLVVGYDHHFGRKGEGTYETIKECAGSYGFRIEQIREYSSGESAISSSAIREALLEGNLDDASNWLGYNYSFKGTVVRGRRIGRLLGFPTANIRPGDKYKLVPGDGVYAVEVYIDGERFAGMLSIGRNPTIKPESETRSIEVNILNFEKEIYGNEIKVVFRKRLRDEIKFNNTEELSKQMELDRQNTIKLLI